MDALDFIVDRDQHMRPLEYDLSESFNGLLRYMHDMGVLNNVPIGVTSESEIVSVSDAYAAPPRALNVYGKSTQAGTPTPDAPVPILSVDDLSLHVCGKNLCPTADGTTIASDWTRESTNYILHTGIFGNGSPYTLSCRMTGAPSTTGTTNRFYILAAGETSTFCDLNTAGSKSATVTLSGEILLRINTTGATNVASLLKDIQLEVGSTATAYEPYIGITVPDLLPEGTDLRSLSDGTRDTLNLSYLRPSTRDGWAWYSREVLQAVGHVADMGGLAWNDSSSANGIFYAAIDSNSGNGYCLCSCYQSQQSTSSAGLQDGYACKQYGFSRVLVKDTAHAGLVSTEFAALVSGQTFDYRLATPATTTLDPIELPKLPAPNCTVWCDGGSATPTLVLEYVRDVNAAIAELSEAIADIVSG